MKHYLWISLIVLNVGAEASNNPFELKENLHSLDKSEDVILSELEKIYKNKKTVLKGKVKSKDHNVNEGSVEKVSTGKTEPAEKDKGTQIVKIESTPKTKKEPLSSFEKKSITPGTSQKPMVKKASKASKELTLEEIKKIYRAALKEAAKK